MRFRKKIEKDENYVNTALKLCSVSFTKKLSKNDLNIILRLWKVASSKIMR